MPTGAGRDQVPGRLGAAPRAQKWPFAEVPMHARAWLEPCFTHRIVQPFVAILREHGRSHPMLDELARLDAEARVPIRDVLSLIEEEVARTGRHDLGLQAALRMPCGRGGLGYYAASSAGTLGDALVLLARYAPLANEAAAFELRVLGHVAQLELRTRVALNRPAADFVLAATYRCLAHWLGTSEGFTAWFQHREPAARATYQELLPAVALRFEATCDALSFDAALLARPLGSADPELHTILVRQADEQLARIPRAQSLAQRVRAEVRLMMRDGHVDGPRVAAKLGMSRRSLTRHLEQEQTSYSELLGDVRHELALHMLKRTDLAVQEIATHLGYSLTAAFSRAFRRWEGMSPVAYRRSSVQGPGEEAALEQFTHAG